MGNGVTLGQYPPVHRSSLGQEAEGKTPKEVIPEPGGAKDFVSDSIRLRTKMSLGTGGGGGAEMQCGDNRGQPLTLGSARVGALPCSHIHGGSAESP